MVFGPKDSGQALCVLCKERGKQGIKRILIANRRTAKGWLAHKLSVQISLMKAEARAAGKLTQHHIWRGNVDIAWVRPRHRA